MEGHTVSTVRADGPGGAPTGILLDAHAGDGQPTDEVYRGRCGTLLRTSKSFLRHQAAHPVDPAHIAEALATLWVPRRGKLHVSVDLGRTVGLDHRSGVPKSGMHDPILVARRKERKIPTRVVTGVDPTPTSRLTLVATQDHLREMVLVTAYYGRTAPPEPLGELCARSPLEREAAMDFWTRNALIWDERQYAEDPFATTWDRMLSGMWRADAPYVGWYIDTRWG